MPKRSNTNGLEIGEEEGEYLQEENDTLSGARVFVLLFSCNILFMDLIFKCFILLYKKDIVLYHLIGELAL